MRNTVIKRFAMLALLCVLVTVFAVPAASAASYSKVYGQTLDRVRVREDASTNAAIIDNIIKDACVYVTTSKTSGSNTFIKVQYRGSDGDVVSGWICQQSGSETFVKILSSTQAESKFSVSGGNLPSKKVGTFTAAQRSSASSSSSSSSTYIKLGTTGSDTVKSVQTKLKALGLYSGEITGNVGEKTEAAIKAFQSRYGLTADGIAGPQTLAKIDAVYSEKGGSSASSSSSSSGSGLKLGSTGTDVSNLQTDLTTLGYYWAEITGNFGSKTETAVKLFQEEKGLTVDGVAGTKTLNAIASAIASKGGTSANASSSSSGSVFKLNSQGTKVSQLQENLKTLGYYYADITGNFGTKTEAAVIAFQKAKGLTADGVAGTRTLDAIDTAIVAAGGSTSSSSSSASGLKLGSTGDKVSALQQDLTTLGYYYGDITGHYGSMTQTAVKKFQKAKGLTQDGVAGETTLNAIASTLKSNGSTSASSSSSSSGTSLREGDSGTAVSDMQTRLKTLGYYYGDITGSFGSLTRKAVRAFQDAEGLTVDGVAGTATLNKLYSLTGGGSVSGSSSSSGTTVTTAKSYGRIIKDNVYLRSSYSTTSAAKTSLDSGTLVRITKTYVSGGVTWYYITANKGSYTYKGYVRSDMMTVISESEYTAGGGNADNSASGDSETIGMIRVTGNNVALRDEPDGDLVDTADYGDVFYYVDTVSGWFQTRAGYWISSSYATVMSDDEVNSYVGSSSSSSSSSYRYGDTGSMVSWIQQTLKNLGYYDNTVSGHYGSKTEDAVRAFQRDNGLSGDGVAGAKTIAALTAASNNGTGSSATVTYGQTVYNLDWFAAKNAGKLASYGLARNQQATLTDLNTGKTFKIHIQSTGYHADVEPLTAADTATMCAAYGVSTASQIGWQARPMLITTSTGHQIACSIYGEEHGSEDITTNNFDGQFCLHFTGSKTHTGGEVLDRHVKAIASAISSLVNNGMTQVNIP